MTSTERQFERRMNVAEEAAELDNFFDRALGLWEDGNVVSAESLAPDRPELWDRIEELLTVVRDVAVVGGDAGPPPCVPGYELLSELGRGAMGTVFLARQVRLGGRLVALKVLPTSAAASPRARARFQAEANAIARLRHPHIVAVHDVVSDDRVLAYAMEPVDGPSLQGLLEHLAGLGRPASGADVRGYLGGGESALGDVPWWGFVARVGEAMARALAAVHEAGLVHRDVKPSNILLKRDGTPLLTDFGLVRDPASTLRTISDDFVGTAAYAPPEQLRGGRDEVDGRADIYALGTTLFHALTGGRPHIGRTPLELLEQIERGVEGRRELRGAPRDLQTIIAKAMSPEATDRYETARAMAEDLRRLLDARPIDARPTSLVRRAIKLARRKRQVVWGLLGGAVAATLVVTAVVFAVSVLPRWSREAKEEAWIALLDPMDTVTMANAGFFEDAGQSPPKVNAGVLARALAGYERADRYGVAGAQTRLERDVLRAMKAWDEQGVPIFSARLQRRAPLACAWLADWCTASANRPRRDLDYGSVSNDELIAAGLMSYMTTFGVPATRAWLELERRGHSSAYMQAGLGLYFLYALRPDAAYPRIREADLLLPGFAFLRAAHAEAALFAGETALAGVLYEEAQQLPYQDSAQMLRVGRLLDAAQGRLDEIIRIARTGEIELSVERVQIACCLAELGYRDLAVRVLSLASADQSGPVVKRCLVRVAEAWWDGLTQDEREAAVREGLLSSPPVDRRRTTRDVFGDYARAKDALRARPGEPDMTTRPHALEGVCARLAPYIPAESASTLGADEMEAVVSFVLGP